MKWLPVLLLVFLIGCGEEKPAQSLTFADNGKEVTIKKDKLLQIKLPAEEDKDTFWGVKTVPSCVEFLTEGKDDKTFEFNFKVLASGELTIELVRFNETGVEKKKEFKVLIKAE